MWILRRSYLGRFIARHPASQIGWWQAVQARWPIAWNPDAFCIPPGPVRIHVWHTRGILDGIVLGQCCAQFGRPWRMWVHPIVYAELGAPSWAYPAPETIQEWAEPYQWAEAEQGILVIFHASQPRPRPAVSGLWKDLVGHMVLSEADGSIIPALSAAQSLLWTAKRAEGKKICLRIDWQNPT